MKKMFEHMYTQIGYTPLSSHEKEVMKNSISSFAENYSNAHRTRMYVPISNILIFKLRPMIIALCIALALSGSAVFAAENAVPGDVLYPVKIHVTEQIRDVIEISPAEQAEWDLKKAERRLVEAQKLAQRGVLTSDEATSLSERIEIFLARAEDADGSKRDVRAVPVGAHVRALLHAQSDIFDSVVTTTVTGTSWIELKTLLNTLKEKHVLSVTGTTSTIDVGTDSEMAARGKERAAEQKFAEVQSYITRKFPDFSVSSTVQGSVSSTSLEARVRAQIVQARTLLSQGKQAIEQGVYMRAFSLFSESMNVAQEAKILVSTARELNIELRRERAEERSTTSTRDVPERGAGNAKDDTVSDKEKDDRNTRSSTPDTRGSERSAEMRVETPVGESSVHLRIR